MSKPPPGFLSITRLSLIQTAHPGLKGKPNMVVWWSGRFSCAPLKNKFAHSDRNTILANNRPSSRRHSSRRSHQPGVDWSKVGYLQALRCNLRYHARGDKNVSAQPRRARLEPHQCRCGQDFLNCPNRHRETTKKNCPVCWGQGPTTPRGRSRFFQAVIAAK